jgi:ribosomal protein L14E/L6E/L27E
MDLTKELSIGQVVKSRAGRDNGRVFLVLDIIDDQYVHIVDGDLRKLNNPKKKKVKHLIIYNTIIPDFKQKLEDSLTINDADISKFLEPFKESI